MKNKGINILFIIYLVMLLADLISTLIMGELVQHLESNPLYKYGGLSLIIILNIVFMLFFYYIYKRGTLNARFLVLFCMAAVITTRIIAVTNNIAIYMNPPTLEQAMAVTQAVKTEAFIRLALVNIFPFFNGIIAWLFFREDHIIRRKDEIKTIKNKKENRKGIEESNAEKRTI